MAVNALPLESTLQIVVQTGTMANGDPALRTNSYRNVKTGAQDADVYEVAQALAGLQIHPLNAVHRQNEVDLVAV
ncbi:MAG: DUF1659 domain-containing protein [Bacillota bacterium]|nr:DUF1659 domain-containing protein [Bacillota bacterium]